MLKQRLRDYIDPERDLGHSDRGGHKTKTKVAEEKHTTVQEEGAVDGAGAKGCEDCK